jgi:hypothetical protein
VLVLGILGLGSCIPVLGILAWTMGRRDLRAMRTGDMDPSGEGTTRTGMVLGIVGTCIGLAGLLGVVLFGLTPAGKKVWTREEDERRARVQMDDLAAAVQAYEEEHDALPPTLEQLTRDPGPERGGRLDLIPSDPWGNAFRYRPFGRSLFTLRSDGLDGLPNTGDDVVWAPGGG